MPLQVRRLTGFIGSKLTLLEKLARKFKINFILYDSPIILIFGSVPDFLIKSLPLLFISLFAFLIAFLHLVL